MLQERGLYIPEEDFVYIDKLMRETSRTFDYTLRRQPQDIRKDLVCAYQVYRIIDQIEDTDISSGHKFYVMHQVLDCLSDLDLKKAGSLENLLKGIPVTKKGYGELLGNFSRLVSAFAILPDETRRIIVRYGREMADGLSNPGIQKIRTIEDHHVYCHYAASVVGFFVTEDLAFRGYLTQEQMRKVMPSSTERNPEVGRNIAHDFGVALQLTNNIRDFHDDYLQGIYRWPSSLIEKAGLDYGRLADKTISGDELDRAFSILKEQIVDAERYVISSLKWIDELPFQLEGRENVDGIKISWSDALAFSAATLHTINTPEFFTNADRRKITRSEVNRIDKHVNELVRKRESMESFVRLLLEKPV